MAEEALREAIEVGMKGRIAEGKAGLVATTKELAKGLRQRIPTVEGPVVRSMVNLGIYCMAGTRQGRSARNTKTSIRLHKGLGELRRVH